MAAHGEPSVEDILDSIKKVIARDNEDREKLIAGRRPAPADVPEPSDDDEAEEVLELGSYGEELVLSEDELNVQIAEAALENFDGLMRGEAEASLRENFAALATLSQPGKPPQIVRSGETSLEGLVREMLRPMLARWLDENLPGMVEQLVKAEIARIAGKRG